MLESSFAAQVSETRIDLEKRPAREAGIDTLLQPCHCLLDFAEHGVEFGLRLLYFRGFAFPGHGPPIQVFEEIKEEGLELAEPEVVVEDLLIVALGDSFASGESNPDRPVQFSAGREMVYEPALLRAGLA